MVPGPSELILILLIVVVVFGAKRIPEIMGGIGQGIRTFKKAMEGEDTASTPSSPSASNQPLSPTHDKQIAATVDEKKDRQ